MTNTSPKGQRVPAQLAEVVVAAAAAAQGPDGQGAGLAPVLAPRRAVAAPLCASENQGLGYITTVPFLILTF